MTDHIASAITLYLVKNESPFLLILLAPFVGTACTLLFTYVKGLFGRKRSLSSIKYVEDTAHVVTAYDAINKKVSEYAMKQGDLALECKYTYGKGNVYDPNTGRYNAESYTANHTLDPSDKIYTILYGKYIIYAKRYDKVEEKKSTAFIEIYGRNGIEVLKEYEKEALEEFHAWYKELLKKEPLVYKKYELGEKEAWVKSDIPTIKTFENVFLDDAVYDKLKKNIETFKKKEEVYKRYGIPYKKGFMFSGTPGCGKSSVIYAIAYEMKRNIYHVKLNTTKDIHAMKSIPNYSIVVVEDIDTYDVVQERKDEKCEVKKKGKGKKEEAIEVKGEGFIQFNDPALSELLEVMDGYCYLHGCIVIFTTNHPKKIDPALVRPGRIDEHYTFDEMSIKMMSDIVKFYLGCNMKINPSLNGKYTSSYFINSIILPNVEKPEEIEKFLQSEAP